MNGIAELLQDVYRFNKMYVECSSVCMTENLPQKQM